MKCSSERQSSGGSTALWCHCSSRWVLVKLPSFSAWEAAGRKNTSVPMSCGRSSPVSISGPSYQNEAVSISWRSRTTSHLSLDIARRWSLELADPTAGFSPTTKKPGTFPSSIRSIVA